MTVSSGRGMNLARQARTAPSGRVEAWIGRRAEDCTGTARRVESWLATAGDGRHGLALKAWGWRDGDEVGVESQASRGGSGNA